MLPLGGASLAGRQKKHTVLKLKGNQPPVRQGSALLRPATGRRRGGGASKKIAITRRQKLRINLRGVEPLDAREAGRLPVAPLAARGASCPPSAPGSQVLLNQMYNL